MSKTATTLGHFTVQPITENSAQGQAACIHVDARNPIHAAEIALGETLVVHASSNEPRAMAWRLSDDYVPISVTLYRPA